MDRGNGEDSLHPPTPSLAALNLSEPCCHAQRQLPAAAQHCRRGPAAGQGDALLHPLAALMTMSRVRSLHGVPQCKHCYQCNPPCLLMPFSLVADGPAPSFSLHAPSGISSDDDDGQEALSRAPAGSRGGRRLSGVRRLTPAELALAEVAAQVDSRLRLESQKKVVDLERALLEIEADEAAAAAAAAADKDRAAADAAAAEAEAAAARRQQRSQLLSKLRDDAKAEAAKGERQVAQLEAAMKKKQEAAAAAAKAQAEKKAAAEAAAKEEAQRQKQQAEAKKAAEQASALAAKEAAEKQREASAAAPAAGLRIAPSAAEWERQCAQQLAEAQVGEPAFGIFGSRSARRLCLALPMHVCMRAATRPSRHPACP